MSGDQSQGDFNANSNTGFFDELFFEDNFDTDIFSWNLSDQVKSTISEMNVSFLDEPSSSFSNLISNAGAGSRAVLEKPVMKKWWVYERSGPACSECRRRKIRCDRTQPTCTQ